MSLFQQWQEFQTQMLNIDNLTQSNDYKKEKLGELFVVMTLFIDKQIDNIEKEGLFNSYQYMYIKIKESLIIYELLL